MFLLDVGGAALTAATLALLAYGGALLAHLLLAGRSERDLLGFAVAIGVCAVGEATLVALALGALGALRLPHAAGAQVVIVLVLRSVAPPLGMAPLRAVVGVAWDRLCGQPALALIGLHAIGFEALRGMLRPPLSWDSLMYHLYLAATWLQDEAVAPVFAANPLLTHSYFPANGSIWLWWWLAPSHSELYVNLAFLPQTLLLALASGGVARELGAGRLWPVAAYLVLLTPTVIRWSTSQNSDLPLAAALVSACFFGLRWSRGARWGDALLAGLAAGLAIGTKVLGPPYVLVLAIGTIALSRGAPARRALQVAASGAVAIAIGGYFYLRNLHLGVGVLGRGCGPGRDGGLGLGDLPVDPLGGWLSALAQTRWLVRGIFGGPGIELGIGPQAAVLLLVVMALPFVAERRAALVVTAQIAAQGALVLSLQAGSMALFVTNLRYMMGGIALALAGAVAVAERRRVPPGWLSAIAIALCVQGLFQFRPELTTGERLAIAAADMALVVLALASGLRSALRRHRRSLAAACAVALLCCVPATAAFRTADRARALAQEGRPYASAAKYFGRAWGWLDRHGADGAVAVAAAPDVVFVYPAMGMRLERRATYVNVNAEDHRDTAAYEGCDPRVRASASAWLANLAKQDIRWLHVGRYPGMRFPPENRWARSRPEQFALRYRDETNRIYERLPAGALHASHR